MAWRQLLRSIWTKLRLHQDYGDDTAAAAGQKHGSYGLAVDDREDLSGKHSDKTPESLEMVGAHFRSPVGRIRVWCEDLQGADCLSRLALGNANGGLRVRGKTVPVMFTM